VSAIIVVDAHLGRFARTPEADAGSDASEAAAQSGAEMPESGRLYRRRPAAPWSTNSAATRSAAGERGRRFERIKLGCVSGPSRGHDMTFSRPARS
jgi:hypothetical protein